MERKTETAPRGTHEHEERPPDAGQPIPPNTGRRRSGGRPPAQHAPSPPENARAPVGWLAVVASDRPTRAAARDELGHPGVPRGGLRQGLGHRRGARRHLPGQHLPGLELGLQRPLRAHRRRGAVGGAGAHLRRPVPGRGRRRGRAAGLRASSGWPWHHGRRVDRRHRAGDAHRPAPLQRRAERPRGGAADRAVRLLPALLHPPGAVVRGRDGRHRRAVRQTAVRDRGGRADRQRGDPRGDDGRRSGSCTGPRPDLDLTTPEKLVLAIGGTLGVVGFVGVPTVALLRSRVPSARDPRRGRPRSSAACSGSRHGSRCNPTSRCCSARRWSWATRSPGEWWPTSSASSRSSRRTRSWRSRSTPRSSPSSPSTPAPATCASFADRLRWGLDGMSRLLLPVSAAYVALALPAMRGARGRQQPTRCRPLRRCTRIARRRALHLRHVPVLRARVVRARRQPHPGDHRRRRARSSAPG